MNELLNEREDSTILSMMHDLISSERAAQDHWNVRRGSLENRIRLDNVSTSPVGKFSERGR